MRKQLEIGGVGVTFESNALTPRLYKLETGRDFFSDLFRIFEGLVGIDGADQKALMRGMQSFDADTLTMLCYVMAKTADKVDGVKTPPYDEWLLEHRDFNIFSHGMELIPFAVQTIETKKK